MKNRPFYSEVTETVIFEESTVSFTNTGAGFYYATIQSAFNPVSGKTYNVSWDGAAYECVCKTFSGYNVIGNLSIMGAGADTGEPFFISPLADDSGAEIYTLDTSASHTFSISGFVSEAVKIDEKYLPELPYMGKVNPTGTGSFSLNRKDNTTVGEYSFAEGEDTTASGDVSHAEGFYCEANASFSHAEGCRTIVSDTEMSVPPGAVEDGLGKSGHAEGFGTLVTGQHGAHAEGCKTLSSGSSSHAEGRSTTASGAQSHAEGYYTTASGTDSHAEGDNTVASSDYQHVQGKYNIEDPNDVYAHIVGNGTSSSARSNAHTLDWGGNAWYAGTVEGKALILPSSTENSTKQFKITVDDSGTISATEVTT